VLFVRETTLFAQSFDDERLAVAGEPQPVRPERLSANDPDTFALFLQLMACLIYQQEAFLRNRQHVWLDRHGQAIGRVGEPAFTAASHLAPDGSQAAMNARRTRGDLCCSTSSGNSARVFTTNPARNWNATWSPDASRIIYASTQSGPPSLWQKAVGGAGAEELILRPVSRSTGLPMGNLCCSRATAILWVLADPRASSDRTPIRLMRTTFSETVGSSLRTDAGWRWTTTRRTNRG